MKLSDITTLNESMTFMPAGEETHDDGGITVTPHNFRRGDVSCDICDGSGIESWGNGGPCGMCKGKGHFKSHIHDGPELNVANANARVIASNLLGVEPDDYGFIKHADLPGVIRRLMSIVNSDNKIKQSTQDTYDNEKDRKMVRSKDSNGVTSIGREMRMVDMGRTDEQVKRYAKEMMKIVKYAMDHKLGVTWS